jgi:hypothetical protein
MGTKYKLNYYITDEKYNDITRMVFPGNSDYEILTSVILSLIIVIIYK